MAQSEQRAKRPSTILAGPYGHPIHPMLIPIPIGVWVASFLFDLGSRVLDDKRIFAEGAYWLIGIGILAALVAALFGFMDLLSIPRGTRVFKVGLTHMSLNLTVTVLFAVSFFVRLSQGYDRPTPGWLIILSAVALVLLTVSGWLGGRMAYHYGVRVADEETQAEGYR